MLERAAPDAMIVSTTLVAEPELEAARTLADRARGKFGELAIAPLVQLALRAARGTDYPVAEAALDALARRFAFAERDALRVLARPRAGEVAYRVGRRRGDPRSYEVWLRSSDPIEASCSCADYARSSLGVCKHGMVVLAAVQGKRGRPTREAPPGPVLRWDPTQPLGIERTLEVAAPPGERFDRAARLRVEGASGRAASLGPPPAESSLEARRAHLKRLRRAIDTGALWAEPAARTIVHEEFTRTVRLCDARRAAPAAQAALRGLARRLYPYQSEGIERLLASGRLLLADDMGLGKTTQAVAVCHALLESRTVRRALLVVPAALKAQWAREWSWVTQVPLTVVSGPPAEREQLYASTARGALLVGYEQLLRDLRHVSAWLPELVVLDEAQRIKNWETKSAAAVKSLAPRYRLVLTGTPMENRLAELASIVDFVDDVALEPKWRLAPFHTFEQGDAAEGSAGARHLGALRARLAPVMLRRVRQEVLAQLPERTDTRVPVELSEPQREEHDELDRPVAALLRASERRPLRQEEFLRLMQLMTRQRMLCNGLAQVRFGEEWERLEGRRPTDALLASLFAPKLGAFRALVQELVLTQRRKIVVFSQWRSMLRLAAWSIGDVLGDAGMRPGFFTGAESSALRERAIVDFHDDPGVPVLFLTDAGGVGLNLQRAASACIQLELPWNPAVMEQRIGRIHRLGQPHPIDVYHLVSEEGIEARIATLIGNKRALFTSLFDGTTDAVIYDRSASFMAAARALYAKEVASSADDEDAWEEDVDDLAPILDLEAEDAPGPRAPAPSPAVPSAVASSPAAPAPAAPAPAVLSLAAPAPAVLSLAAPSADAAQSAPAPPAPAPSAPAPAAPSSEVAPFRVTTRSDGGLSIDVPPGLAGPLAGLLAQLAQALRQDAGAPPGETSLP